MPSKPPIDMGNSIAGKRPSVPSRGSAGQKGRKTNAGKKVAAKKAAAKSTWKVEPATTHKYGDRASSTKMRGTQKRAGVLTKDGETVQRLPRAVVKPTRKGGARNVSPSYQSRTLPEPKAYGSIPKKRKSDGPAPNPTRKKPRLPETR